MKTLSKLVLQFALLLFVFSILTNCKSDDITNESIETLAQDEPLGLQIETRKVDIDEISGLDKYLRRFGVGSQARITGSNIVVTPFGNIPLEDITEVIDTLGNINYTFAIIPSVYRENKFFNLIIHQEPEQEEFSGSVLEYELEDNYANDFYNGIVGLSNFHGTIRSYTAEEFLAITGNEGNRACGEDTVSTIDPCVEGDVDNSDGGPASNDGTGEGSGVGDSNNGDPIEDGDLPDNDDGFVGGGGDTGLGAPCTVGLYIENCNGDNTDVLHLYADCDGPDKSTGDVYTVVDCGTGIQRTATRDGIGCPINGGPAAISPVPFASLGTAFGLTPAEDLCLGGPNNCDLKNDIYQFLNANILPDGSYWEQNAMDFTGLVLDELLDDCNWDFEVDFDDGVILDSTFTNTPIVKCVYDKLARDNSTLFRDTVGSFINDPQFNLVFKVGNCNSTDNACTNADNVNTTGEIIIKIENVTTDPINLATSILHESIHAELIRYVAQYQPGVDPNNRPYLFELYKYYKGLYDNTDIDHIYMTLNFINPIASALRQFDNNNYPTEYYKVFAWDGLRRWDADNLLSMEQNSLYETYRPIVISNSIVCE